MVEKKKGKRISNLVGFRRKKLTGRQLVIAGLIKHFGGATKITKLVNGFLPDDGQLDRQMFTTWRNKGLVPIKHVKKLAVILEVPEYLLNFYGMENFYGKEQNWETLIKNCTFLGKGEKEEILERKI
jgi:hypothetical protein